MSYKTILVHADQSRNAVARVAMAVALARDHGAVLVGAAVSGVSGLVYPLDPGIVPGGVLDAYFGALRSQLNAALLQFERLAAPSGVTRETRLLVDDAGQALAQMARFADLVVLSQDDPDESLAFGDPRLPDHVILNAPRPVLVVPVTEQRTAGPPRRILLAWNGSRQAAAAVTAALPLLARADTVTVAAFSEDRTDAMDGETVRNVEHADLKIFLERHGVQARIDQRAEPVDMGHAILDLAAELACDLIVMGCYGHARLRELYLGGVSRTLLRRATIPLLMAHQ